MFFCAATLRCNGILGASRLLSRPCPEGSFVLNILFPERLTRSGFWWRLFWLAPISLLLGKALADYLLAAYGTGALLLYLLCLAPPILLASSFAAARANDIRRKGGDDVLAHIGFGLPLGLTFCVAVLDEVPQGLQPKLLGQPAILQVLLVGWFLSLGFCVVSFLYLLCVGPRDAREAPVDVDPIRHPFWGAPAALFGLMFFVYAFGVCVAHYKAPGLLARAEKGEVLAQADVAEMYHDGIGAKRNYAESFKWMSRAAKTGNMAAIFFLGEAHEKGEGTPRNLIKAVELYRQSAQKGWGPAQLALGECYAQGKGIKRDYVQAYKWYSSAALAYEENGSAGKARDRREKLKKLMTPAQIKEAERISPKPPKPPKPVKTRKT